MALQICNETSDLKPDGKIGKNTRAALRTCRKDENAVFDEDNVKELMVLLRDYLNRS